MHHVGSAPIEPARVSARSRPRLSSWSTCWGHPSRQCPPRIRHSSRLGTGAPSARNRRRIMPLSSRVGLSQLPTGTIVNSARAASAGRGTSVMPGPSCPGGPVSGFRRADRTISYPLRGTARSPRLRLTDTQTRGCQGRHGDAVAVLGLAEDLKRPGRQAIGADQVPVEGVGVGEDLTRCRVCGSALRRWPATSFRSPPR